MPEGDWSCAVCRGVLSEADLLISSSSCPIAKTDLLLSASGPPSAKAAAAAVAPPCNVCGVAGDDMLVYAAVASQAAPCQSMRRATCQNMSLSEA